ncbi:hypothetical protein AALP_AA4G124300 [Arabis alpina]|uniref:SANTA domain-containing protein n=1 Tax=Arabis alpina TaxID=50452 RepID=A0A087H2T5_ARAAL|nr:hypothetical protein AALP_AA4G124300 [Arabis alpina]
MTNKSKSQSLSTRRTSPRIFSRSLPEPNSSPRTLSRALPKRNFSPGTDGIPRTPFSLGAITPVIGTLKSVSLSDWWLTKKTKENGLGIEGFESKSGSVARRLFSSGAITKRHDSTNLETFDGITVCISGFINQSRTLQNGISLDVCNRFLLGFPYNWKEESVETKKADLGISFDDIPVSRLQDLLVTTCSTCLKSKILDHVVDSLRDLTCPTNNTQKSDKKCEEKLLPMVVGVKTRGMLRQREDNEASSSSIGKLVLSKSKKKR